MQQFNKNQERELAFLFIYQMLSEGGDKTLDYTEGFYDEFWEGLHKDDSEGLKYDLTDRLKFSTFQIIKSTVENLSKSEEVVTSLLEKKNLNYLDKIEHALLVIATTELSTNELKKSEKSKLINFYIDLAKKYGKEKSYGLVNGVLDKI